MAAGIDPRDTDPLMAIPTGHKTAQVRNRFEVTEEYYLHGDRYGNRVTWHQGRLMPECVNSPDGEAVSKLNHRLNDR